VAGDLDLTEVRVHLYRRLADDAHAITAVELARHFEAAPDEAVAALRALHDAHLVVLDEARERIVMAHPWATAPMGFVVASAQQKWWGGCAWDSFAIPALVGATCLVATHCPGCGTPIALDVAPDEPPAGDQVAHLLVPVPRIWDDVVFTCSNQLLFCDDSHVDRWLRRTQRPRGAVLDLPTLWRLATGWYAGRLTPGYRRRNPEEAAAFFTTVGLTGDFWRTA